MAHKDGVFCDEGFKCKKCKEAWGKPTQIEQLTARVRELEEENARLKVATNFGKSKDIHRLTEVVLSDCGISTEYRPLLEKVENRLYEFFDEQLVTSQAYAEQLRVALQTFIDEHEECTDADDWMAMLCSIEAHHVAEEALSLPHDTSALDSYVAKRLHDMACDKGLLRIQVEELTRQRDLAVEALEHIARSLPQIGVERVWMMDHANKVLSTIKESEAK